MVNVSLKRVITILAGGLSTPCIIGEAVMAGETSALVLPVVFVLLHKSLIRRVALVWRKFPTGF